MTALRLFWHDYRYFPYERILAKREAQLLCGGVTTEGEGCLLIPEGNLPPHVASRLTYFKAVDFSEGLLIPDQAKLEASAIRNGQGWLSGAVPSLRRQSTRYSAHGLHEYRGKFNPQVVRAIGNIFGLEEGAWVLDPFCGSGTTLLESAHVGWNALGIDINPLGILIANAKITAFKTPPVTLSRECETLATRLDPIPDGSGWRTQLPDSDYLEKWFPKGVLWQLSAILQQIQRTCPVALQDVFRVVLSDICREVSLQEPSDLRIRRRKNPADNYPAARIFLESLRAKVSSVVRARQQIQLKKSTMQLAIFGDSRSVDVAVRPILERRKKQAFDAAITSPPYATAMPYLDTQRLSLALLGLLRSRELRGGERQLIGNREIQDKERIELEEQLRANVAQLPENVITFCRHLLELADDASHGFRRRNVPALLYKYLVDMASMFVSVFKIIRSKGRYALLVGRNSTNLRDKVIVIDTPQLLAEVATSRGWQLEEKISLETYHRFDVHRENSIREEVLLILRRP